MEKRNERIRHNILKKTKKLTKKVFIFLFRELLISSSFLFFKLLLDMFNKVSKDKKVKVRRRWNHASNHIFTSMLLFFFNLPQWSRPLMAPFRCSGGCPASGFHKLSTAPVKASNV